MKLLIVTQKVDINDDVLGFMHGWIAEFAKHCEKLTVICLQKGEYDLPKNVKVLSLGKEKYLREEVRLRGGAKRRKKPNLKEQIFFRIKYIFNFYKYIWQERGNYDKVFVHMNPEYVVLGGVFWRLWGKKIGLWYTHKSVNLKLRIAEKMADVIFTASKESFRLMSSKVMVAGHGIDVDHFSPDGKTANTILTVGRISPTKHQLDIIKAYKKSKITNKLKIIGVPITFRDRAYEKEIKDYLRNNDLNVFMMGSISQKDIVKEYQDASLFVHISSTGSLDKVILEAILCGLSVVTSNRAFTDILGAEYITSERVDEISDKIEYALNHKQKNVREHVVQNHNLKNLIPFIVSKMI